MEGIPRCLVSCKIGQEGQQVNRFFKILKIKYLSRTKGRIKKLNQLFSRNFPRMGGRGHPPSVKIINFFKCSENVQNALKHVVK